MATYLEKISAAQKGINSFYKLLDIYKASRLNNGWVGTETEIVSDIYLSKFNSYFTDNGIVPINKSTTATLFDIPMSSRGYDKNGKYASGIPSDVGFTKNVERDNEGNNMAHSPLYAVSDKTSITAFGSYGADTTIGGKVEYNILADGIEVYPNGSSTSFISKLPSTYSGEDILFPILPLENANSLHMLYCFVSASYENGIVLYVTPNFISWNTHIIINPSIESTAWYNITGRDINMPYTREDASLVQGVIEKYFRVLPNNNYLIMCASDMYYNKNASKMITLYSPWNSVGLMIIKDPYDTIYDYEDKAINGFSSFMSENGEIVLYYNNRKETPMILYNGRTLGTFTGSISDNYKNEIIESPLIAKSYDAIIDNSIPNDLELNGIAIDYAISIMESKNNSLSDKDIPAAFVNIALGDIGRPYIDNSNDQVNLYVNNKFEGIDNIDTDFTDYVFANNIDGRAYLSGEDDVDLTSTEGVVRAFISNNGKLSVIEEASSHRDNVRYRSFIVGNSLIDSDIKTVNNPSIPNLNEEIAIY